MIWKKDKLKPVQPYFVLDKESYVQRLSNNKDISHYYRFSEESEGLSRIVPDGCVDIFFEYTDKGLRVQVCGTRLNFSTESLIERSEVFGIRFMPGILPVMLDVKIGELTGKVIDFEEIKKGDAGWLGEMESERDFLKQIKIFEEACAGYERAEEKPFGRDKLVRYTKELIYSSDGKVKISEIEKETGYSERYINKVFNEEMGFSPKSFCKIIQFQRALEYLDYGAPGKMTDASVKLGFYDQSQFIKDFKRYAGITPKRYLDMVEGADYKNLMKRSMI